MEGEDGGFGKIMKEESKPLKRRRTGRK